MTTDLFSEQPLDPVQQFQGALSNLEDPSDALFLSPLLTEQDREALLRVIDSTMVKRMKVKNGVKVFAETIQMDIDRELDFAVKAIVQHEINKRKRGIV